MDNFTKINQQLMCFCLVLFVKFLHNIFHNVKFASSGEIDYSDFTVCFPFKDKGFFDLFEITKAMAMALFD